MSTILPPTILRWRERDMLGRFIATLSFAVMGLAALFVITLVPSFVIVSLRTMSDTAPAADVARMTADTSRIQRVQGIVASLKSLAATSSPSNDILLLISYRPSGVRILSISYRLIHGTPSPSVETISVSGIAASPSALSAFRENVLNSGVYQSVTVPAADLAGARDGAFTITITRSI